MVAHLYTYLYTGKEEKLEVHDIDGPPVTGTPVGSRTDHYYIYHSEGCIILIKNLQIFIPCAHRNDTF